MADDTVETATARLQVAIGVCIHKRSELSAIQPAIDALIAAVRAEKGVERFVDGILNAVTVVKLRDDETSPVAAPCAIAGACQYPRHFKIGQEWVTKVTNDPEIDGEGVLPNTANKADTSTFELGSPRTPFAVCLCGHVEPMHRPTCRVALCECGGFAATPRESA